MKKTYITLFLILFVIFEGFSREVIDSETKTSVIRNGIGLGSVIAAVTSWERNKSVLLAIIHGFFSWLYVLYFLFTRKESERK
ncbi:hypothetical protein [Christiangramia sabulilitoris]|uniref:Uncharacterized protein n=1 Tax=Christiangramia sabulilitoris TaxID=2583991 RepID=A0A550I0M3_9FLAO|nr:hypothetical protein [Christiangramia sabulilitoris]TRO64521.1 hypothetical protein FGM01_13615 [Christiangramia sabulilitoris]